MKNKFVWLTGFSILLSIIFIIQFYVIYNDNLELSKLLRQEDYVRERITVDEILSPNDRYLKVSKFYSAIIATYGVKYHQNKGRENDQGLSHYQKPDFILEVYRLCNMLDIPYMLPMAMATFESSFRPYVQTDFETGIFQHRPEAVGQAWIYYYQLSPEYQKKCSFYYNDREDLKDIINAIRIQMVLLWGYKKDFANNQAYYISSAHWGLHRIWPMYSRGIAIPDEFSFNKGTVDEDCRNPMMYYFIINSYLTAYNRFDLNVWVETAGYKEVYKKACSKLEWGYLEGWKYAQDLLETAKEVELNNSEYKEKNEKLIKKYNDKIKQVDEEYRRIHGLMMQGKYRDIKDLFNLARQEFRAFRDDVMAGRLKTYRVIIHLSSILIFLLNTLFLIYFVVKYFKTRGRRYEEDKLG